MQKLGTFISALVKQAESRDMPVKAESDAQSDYYTIALLGKSGQGKSTTGNKLLGISDENEIISSKCQIKEWGCTEEGLLKHCTQDELKAFKCGGGAQSVTKQCQMFSNEQTRIRVLDIPGFGDSDANNKSTNQRNAGLIDSVLKIQNNLNIRFHRILYFLPFRGPFKRSDAYCQDELKTLYFYFGVSIFKCMVIILTKDVDDSPGFSENAYKKTRETVLFTMTEVTKIENTMCPPVMYIPFNVTPDELLRLVQTAPVDNDITLDPTKLYPEYSGDEKWTEWIEKFESAAAQKSLHDKAKVQTMKMIFDGDKKAAFAKVELDKVLEKDANVTYNDAKLELQTHIYSARYATRKKKLSEEWKDFADDLCALAKIAFPHMQADSIEEMIIADIRVHASSCVRNLALPDAPSLDSIVIIITATEKIPDAYTAEDMGKGWKDWISTFEVITTQKSLDTCTKVLWLKARLAGKALEFFNGLAHEQCINYAVAKKALSKNFNDDLFQSKKRLPSERWDTYADELSILAQNCYPDLVETQHEAKVLKHILSQVDNKSHKSREWKSLKDAVIVIAATCEIQNAYCDITGKSWRNWLTDFETKCGNSNKQKMQWLKARIGDDLLPLFEVCEKTQGNYVRITNAFEDLLKCLQRLNSWNTLPISECKALHSELISLVSIDEDNSAAILSIIKTNGISLPVVPGTLEEAFALLFVMKRLNGKYSGKGSYEKWIFGFESAVSSTGYTLTDAAKVVLLRGHLDTQALSWFESSCEWTSYDYGKVKQCFEIKLFNSITRILYENWENFAKDLTFLAIKAHPCLNDGARKAKVLECFLADPMMKLEVKCKNPETIDIAVISIMAVEGMPHAYCDKTGQTWRMWLKMFESICGAENSEKLKWLSARISDELLPSFKNVCKEMKDDYMLATNAFQELLESQEKFYSMKKSSQEEWQDICDDLSMLATKFIPKEDRNRMVIDQLLLVALNNGVNLKFLRKQPETVFDAVITLSAGEAVSRSEMYSAEESWESWIEKFEKALYQKGKTLTDDAKVMFLQDRLQGSALKLFNSLSNNIRGSYVEVKRALKTKLYEQRFKFLNSKSYSQDWEAFATELNTLAEKAYPDMQDIERENIVFKHFIADSIIKDYFNKKNPKSIKDAIEIKTNREVCKEVESIYRLKLESRVCFIERLIKIAGKAPKITQKCVFDKLKELVNEEDVEFPRITPGTLGGAILVFKVIDAMHSKQLMGSASSDDWEDWITYFEETIDTYAYESDGNEKLQCFEAFISEEYTTDTEYDKRDFESAKFSVIRVIYTTTFQRGLEVKSKSLSKLAADLRMGGGGEEEVLAHFLDIVNNPALNEKNPRTTDEAIKLLECRTKHPIGVQLSNKACTKCCLSFIEKGIVQDEGGNIILYHESCCHAEMIYKYTRKEKILGGFAHIATLGTALVYEAVTSNEVWPGFTNDKKVCWYCSQGFGTPGGCKRVGDQYTIEGTKFTIDHTCTL